MAIAAEPPVASIGSSRKTRASAEVLRHLLVVPARHGGLLVALETEVTDLRLGHELEQRVEHAEACPQHRHRDHARGQPLHRRGLERRLDRGLAERQVARGLRDQEQAHPVGELPEGVGGRPAIPQRGEDVLDQRMPDHVHVHASPIEASQASRENSLAAAFLMSSGIVVASLFSRSRSTHLNPVLMAIVPVAACLSRW